ncbi:MAG: glucose-1-phosphate cytidylyltransferase [Clostridia bacterium]|nr:glucose-1-phosphate cytidylyltransferase [Clostridia bacterium]
MKVVILAGGLGTRISEESHLKPKPMIEIGEEPILWHIMKHYSRYGFNEFIICLGYKSFVVKDYFANYYLHTSDVTFDLGTNDTEYLSSTTEHWKVTLAETGLNTMTGGRIKRVQHYIGNETFMLTYGDGVSDVNLNKLLKFHKEHGKIGTITAVSAGQRFGVLGLGEGDVVEQFREKKDDDSSTINGGFMVMEPEIFNYLEDDKTVFENAPLETLAAEGQLMAYRHNGFWHCMDTQRDKKHLEELWQTGHAPWKTWR